MIDPRFVLTGFFLGFTGFAGAEESTSPFVLGVQTHFEQGWSTDLINSAQKLNVLVVRDEIGWSEVEMTKGQYDFTRADMYMAPLIEKGIRPLIVITDTNPLYDDGNTPYTAEGMEGLASYISAILDHYGVENVQIEIGNEVNSDDFVVGPFTENKAKFLAETVRRVKARLRADHPDARIICTGLHSVAIGFYRDFFRRGGLQSCDAISVHPYNDNPGILLGELARLNDLMDEFGGKKPIYVTEFGQWFEDPEDAPDFMTKMVVQMSAVGVREAYWYALVDEPWWPNMGLLARDGTTRKPAWDAFDFLQTRVLNLGRPVSLSKAATAKLYGFGDGQVFVAWGNGAELIVSGEATYFDTQGRETAPRNRVNDSPLIIVGDALEVQIEQKNLVADTKYEFNQPPWSYFARRPDIGLTPLEIIDWNWTSFRGAPDLSPLQIGHTWITAARFHAEPYHAVERFTATLTGEYEIEGWWQGSEETDASRLVVRHNDRDVFTTDKIPPERITLSGLSLTLTAGDTLDFEIIPMGEGLGGAASVSRRINIKGPATPD